MPSDMSARRPAALMRGPEREAEVERAGAARLAAGDAEQRGDAGLHAAGADALETLRDEQAVVRVEPHHVGDGAERDEVEQAIEARLRGPRRTRRAARSSARSASST